jgi:hypothetical protein
MSVTLTMMKKKKKKDRLIRREEKKRIQFRCIFETTRSRQRVENDSTGKHPPGQGPAAYK